jgi:hypothetical protein
MIHQLSAVNTIFAFAACFAPNPAAARAHGGIWIIPKDSKKRGLNVLEDGPPIQLQSLSELFTSSVQVVLDEARDTKKFETGRIGGRTRYDADVIEGILATLKTLLQEATVYGLAKHRCMREAFECQAHLSGLLNIEALLRQAENEEATRASWMKLSQKCVLAFCRKELTQMQLSTTVGQQYT